jgi:hypothetical protein
LIGKKSSRNCWTGIGPTRYFSISAAIAVHDSIRHLLRVLNGSVVEVLILIGVDRGSGKVVFGGVVAMVVRDCGGRQADQSGLVICIVGSGLVICIVGSGLVICIVGSGLVICIIDVDD